MVSVFPLNWKLILTTPLDLGSMFLTKILQVLHIVWHHEAPVYCHVLMILKLIRGFILHWDIPMAKFPTNFSPKGFINWWSFPESAPAWGSAHWWGFILSSFPLHQLEFFYKDFTASTRFICLLQNIVHRGAIILYVILIVWNVSASEQIWVLIYLFCRHSGCKPGVIHPQEPAIYVLGCVFRAERKSQQLVGWQKANRVTSPLRRLECQGLCWLVGLALDRDRRLCWLSLATPLL